MPDEAPLTDNQAHDRLEQARHALGAARGASKHADTALSAARHMLKLLGFGLLWASEHADKANDPPPDSSRLP